MLYGNFVERSQTEIPIEDVDYESMLTLIRLLYQTPQKISGENVESILRLSDKYDVGVVTNLAESFLISSDEVASPIKYRLADAFRLHKLQDSCLRSLQTMDAVAALKATDDYSKISDGAKVALLDRIIDLFKNRRTNCDCGNYGTTSSSSG
ncbi:hypothetical protein PFISCL1PPCAC_3592 [Pristionchus fissidentatus]|uniref:BTB domain-containing protein n=1 Tax=Pristionchus fissidentatus TaxID=1538716 RepID=A0AAV5V1D9_9BILA|nr:hypothetical protein PFISCL1PPCAC_3592 [Pristionchus fissidentatus]